MRAPFGYKPQDLQEAQEILYFWTLRKENLETYSRGIDLFDETNDGEQIFDAAVDDLLDVIDEIERLNNVIERFIITE